MRFWVKFLKKIQIIIIFYNGSILLCPIKYIYIHILYYVKYKLNLKNDLIIKIPYYVCYMIKNTLILVQKPIFTYFHVF